MNQYKDEDETEKEKIRLGALGASRLNRLMTRQNDRAMQLEVPKQLPRMLHLQPRLPNTLPSSSGRPCKKPKPTSNMPPTNRGSGATKGMGTTMLQMLPTTTSTSGSTKGCHSGVCSCVWFIYDLLCLFSRNQQGRWGTSGHCSTCSQHH